MSLLHSTITYWDRYQDRNVNSVAAFLTSNDDLVKWVKPKEEVIKINVDDVTFEDVSRFSFICAARDGDGAVIEATTSCQVHCR